MLVYVTFIALSNHSSQDLAIMTVVSPFSKYLTTSKESPNFCNSPTICICECICKGPLPHVVNMKEGYHVNKFHANKSFQQSLSFLSLVVWVLDVVIGLLMLVGCAVWFWVNLLHLALETTLFRNVRLTFGPTEESSWHFWAVRGGPPRLLSSWESIHPLSVYGRSTGLGSASMEMEHLTTHLHRPRTTRSLLPFILGWRMDTGGIYVVG